MSFVDDKYLDAKYIKSLVEGYFDDYKSSFKVTVTSQDYENGEYDIEISYRHPENSLVHTYDFQCRFDGTNVEFCFSKNTYDLVTVEKLFINMLFIETQEKENRA